MHKNDSLPDWNNVTPEGVSLLHYPAFRNNACFQGPPEPAHTSSMREFNNCYLIISSEEACRNVMRMAGQENPVIRKAFEANWKTRVM
jgi:hypothetical protein